MNPVRSAPDFDTGSSISCGGGASEVLTTRMRTWRSEGCQPSQSAMLLFTGIVLDRLEHVLRGVAERAQNGHYVVHARGGIGRPGPALVVGDRHGGLVGRRRRVRMGRGVRARDRAEGLGS